MTVWQAMARLEALGYSFRLDDTGRVAARITGAEPQEADALFGIASADRAAAADYVRMRQEGTAVVDEGQRMPLLDALAIGQAVRKGEAELVGTVRLVAADLTVCLWWYPVNGESPSSLMGRYRAALESAVEKRLNKMDSSEWWKLPPEEYEAFCKRYSFYRWLLKDGREEQIWP